MRRTLRLALGPALLFLAVSCRTVYPALEPPPGPLVYALVFVIHGDGSYLFHDDGGRPNKADLVAMERARATAAANPEAEVFVFHQHGRRGLAGKNGTLELYRNGALVLHLGYRRDSGGLEAETALYRSLTRLEQRADVQRAFLYFGHQIPERLEPGYHASLPKGPFGLERLGEGVAGFLPSGRRFDLVVLSTCNNGTPTAVATLAPWARYLVASPADLSLSHLATGTLEHLEQRRPEAGLLAQEFALRAFQDLTERVSTIVTVSVYDIDVLLPRIAGAAADLRARLRDDRSPLELHDCGEDSRLSWLGGLPGVTVHYRPPRFGRDQDKRTHSGFGCLQ
jgi:hypothetical protein